MKRVDPFYQSKEWEAIRLKVLRRDGYKCNKCGVKCLGKKRNRPSPNVDHIVERKKRPDLALDMSNLRTLCSSCHSRRTIMDTHGKNKPEIGLDGYPIQSLDIGVSA